MNCPGQEPLSAYADGECPPAERECIASHLEGCAPCRARVAELRALKTALARSLPSALPAGLERSLLAAAEPRLSPAGLLESIVSGLRRPAAAFAFSAAALALCVWFYRADDSLGSRELPVELLLGAHEDYARVLPLASREAPPASAGEEDGDD